MRPRFAAAPFTFFRADTPQRDLGLAEGVHPLRLQSSEEKPVRLIPISLAIRRMRSGSGRGSPPARFSSQLFVTRLRPLLSNGIRVEDSNGLADCGWAAGGRVCSVPFYCVDEGCTQGAGSRGDNGRSACRKSGQGEGRVCRRMLLGNAVGV